MEKQKAGNEWDKKARKIMVYRAMTRSNVCGVKLVAFDTLRECKESWSVCQLHKQESQPRQTPRNSFGRIFRDQGYRILNTKKTDSEMQKSCLIVEM